MYKVNSLHCAGSVRSLYSLCRICTICTFTVFTEQDLYIHWGEPGRTGSELCTLCSLCRSCTFIGVNQDEQALSYVHCVHCAGAVYSLGWTRTNRLWVLYSMFTVQELYIHWGEPGRTGSEHTVNHQSFPAEIQIYGFNTQLHSNLTVARYIGTVYST